jgi:hypothetical protein
MNFSAFKLSTLAITGILPLFAHSPHAFANMRGEGCSLGTVNGAYALVLKGEVLGVGPIVSVGVSTYDGKGHFSGNQTLNLNGDVADGAVTGTYTVNRDCTGIAYPDGQGPHSFVISKGGDEMDLMNNNSAEVITIHFAKIEADKPDHHDN